MKIAIAGAGYVGLSLAILLSQKNNVSLIDVLDDKVQKINDGISPIKDELAERYLASGVLNLSATTDGETAYKDAQFIIIATPTNYDSRSNRFDTSHVEEAIALSLSINPNATIVIKSTVPVGYTQALADRYPQADILFSPEFLREGNALYDNLHPSRIIVGIPHNPAFKSLQNQADLFANMLLECSSEKSAPTLLMHSTEAEAVKLFSNTYLALRVAFFNELDTYSAARGLDSASIIEGVCLDPRIQAHYNNPSFGYGGYCLPKDTKQLLANYEDVPQNLITAIVDANRTRKDFIVSDVLDKLAQEHSENTAPVIGIYRLIMKEGSDNFRSSSIQGVIKRLAQYGINILIYEPALDEVAFFGNEVTHDLDDLKARSSIILANRWHKDLEDVASKIYTRDLFRRD